MLNNDLTKQLGDLEPPSSPNAIKSVYRGMVPESIRARIANFRQDKKDLKLLADMNAYFHNNQHEAVTYASELAYMNRTRTVPIFPYVFAEQYKKYPVTIERDLENGLFFVIRDNKRLYFPKNRSKHQITSMYRFLLMEQDSLSPHRYMTNQIHLKTPEVLMDVGCAEGILALDLIENLKHAFLFEWDEMWIEALQATFRPWKEKVSIINKYASDRVEEGKTSLDTIASDISGHIIIKLDVEGAEKEVLDGAKNLLNRKNATILCCTYHRKDDATHLNTVLKEFGFKTEFANGYMLFKIDKPLSPPFFRKGLLRGWKE